LLTPYGRLLSHRELSTAGGASPASGAEDDPHGEQAFLYGLLGNALGPGVSAPERDHHAAGPT